MNPSKIPISLCNVTKIYPGAVETLALNHVDVTFHPGTFTSILGQSGSGKSTLLNLIAGIDRPSEGEIHYGDSAIHTYQESQLTKWRGEHIGIVFQFFQLMPTLTILENVLLPMDYLHKIPRKDRRQRAYELLSQVGIEDCQNKLPCEVSGGQQQRAAIARSLANQPDYLIADEPTGNLDQANTESIIALFRELTTSGTSVIMVTHNTQIATKTDRIITLCDGVIRRDTANE